MSSSTTSLAAPSKFLGMQLSLSWKEQEQFALGHFGGIVITWWRELAGMAVLLKNFGGKLLGRGKGCGSRQWS